MSKTMPTRTLTKMSKLCFRFSENQKMKVRRPPKNHQKSMKKRLRKHVGKKSPKLVQNGSTWGPTWVPRGEFILGFSPLGAQHVSFSCFCCFLLFLVAFLGHLGTILGPTCGHFGTILGPFWDHVGTILCHSWTNVFFNFFVLFVFTSLTSLTAFFQGLADCAHRFK